MYSAAAAVVLPALPFSGRNPVGLWLGLGLPLLALLVGGAVAALEARRHPAGPQRGDAAATRPVSARTHQPAHPARRGPGSAERRPPH